MAPGFSPRIVHTMLHVVDMERALGFYRDLLGMTVLVERRNVQTGHWNVFLGFSESRRSAEIELTAYADRGAYEKGDAYGHIGMSVDNCEAACRYFRDNGIAVTRDPKTMPSGAVIAFIEDPEGYPIEVIQPAPPALG